MAQPSLFDEPAARWTDPTPSHEAAWSLVPGNAELIARIRECVRVYGPMTAFDIEDHIEAHMPGRWQGDTIRSAVSRAKLGTAEMKGIRHGRRITLYVLRTVETQPL